MMKTINEKLKTKSMGGFTLIETLLYMGIFSVLLVVLLQIFTGILSTHLESQATSSVDMDGNYILTRLEYDIHNAPGISTPTLGNTCVSPTITTCLTFSNGTSYSLDSSGVFTVNGIRLNSVESKVTSVSFTTLGNSATPTNPNPKLSIQIQLNLQSVAQRPGIGAQTQTFQTTVATR